MTNELNELTEKINELMDAILAEADALQAFIREQAKGGAVA